MSTLTTFKLHNNSNFIDCNGYVSHWSSQGSLVLPHTARTRSYTLRQRPLVNSVHSGDLFTLELSNDRSRDYTPNLSTSETWGFLD